MTGAKGKAKATEPSGCSCSYVCTTTMIYRQTAIHISRPPISALTYILSFGEGHVAHCLISNNGGLRVERIHDHSGIPLES